MRCFLWVLIWQMYFSRLCCVMHLNAIRVNRSITMGLVCPDISTHSNAQRPYDAYALSASRNYYYWFFFYQLALIVRSTRTNHNELNSSPMWLYSVNIDIWYNSFTACRCKNVEYKLENMLFILVSIVHILDPSLGMPLSNLIRKNSIEGDNYNC